MATKYEEQEKKSKRIYPNTNNGITPRAFMKKHIKFKFDYLRRFFKFPRRRENAMPLLVRGFTLIEILIYVSMLVIVSVFVINTILIMTKSFGSIKTTRIINTSSEVAMERMIGEIRLADSIDVNLSDFDSHPGKLILNTIDPFTEAVTTIEFSISGNTLQVKKGASSAVPLTAYDVRVNNLIFKRLINSTVSEAIKIELELESGKGNNIKSSKFYSTVVLRRSY